MDWARDNAGLSDRDLDRVFKYEPKQTTALLFMPDQPAPVVSSLQEESDWEYWLKEEVPSPQTSGPGLVLILAKRAGEREFGTVKRIDSDGWLQRIDQNGQARTRAEKLSKLAALSENATAFIQEKLPGKNQQSDAPQDVLKGGQRSVRTLPFSKDIFKMITEKMHIHGTIARAISRSDIPVFSSYQVEMKTPQGEKFPAQIYNCRTTHAWKMDLALTVTHFPHCGLTYAVLFGCPVEIEEEIIRRLCFASAEASHPLVIPGIFAELERTRHVEVVEKTITRLETHILELDFHRSTMEGQRDPEAESRNEDKREAWLDTAYLRNGLIGWGTQLRKMAQCIGPLESTIFSDHAPGSNNRAVYNEQMKRAGAKIESRLLELIEEYDDKIRDCTMRVDGMAMATQWSHGESNVEIALATGRDSKQMRSLALLTMVFLPGTFFATVFSMTFFNWAEVGTSAISPYIWVYVVFTTISTILTVGSWYYFVIHRPRVSIRICRDNDSVV